MQDACVLVVGLQPLELLKQRVTLGADICQLLLKLSLGHATVRPFFSRRRIRF